MGEQLIFTHGFRALTFIDTLRTMLVMKRRPCSRLTFMFHVSG